MATRVLIGLLGSLFGLAVPLATLSISSPLLGWHALGGVEPYSLFWMEPELYHRGDGDTAPLSLSDPPCPGEPTFRRLAESPLPRSGGVLPYDGLVACVLAEPDGRLIRAQIMDSQGKTVRDPRLAAFIISNWRFESSGDVPGWERIRLDGMRTYEPLLPD